MKPVLVTGATGFIGWHVARGLLESGFRVKALVRPESRLRELDSESIVGDLRDAESLRRAVADCSLVFHVAADYRLWVKNPEQLYSSNAAGTRNMLKAAQDAGVERFVYTSTVGCIGVPQDGVGDESRAVSLREMKGAYKRSKFLAEQAALEYAASGFPVVIVNPTAPVGERDVKPTPTGKIVVDFLRGAMPAYLDTGLNVVDVRDVAKGHLLAAEHGRSGERYILGSENLTLQEIFGRLERVSGIKSPKLRIPYAAAYGVAIANAGWARITGKPPRAPLDGVKMARKKMFVSHQKASEKLGYLPGGVDDALRRAVDWFKANGYC